MIGANCVPCASDIRSERGRRRPGERARLLFQQAARRRSAVPGTRERRHTNRYSDPRHPVRYWGQDVQSTLSFFFGYTQLLYQLFPSHANHALFHILSLTYSVPGNAIFSAMFMAKIVWYYYCRYTKAASVFFSKNVTSNILLLLYVAGLLKSRFILVWTLIRQSINNSIDCHLSKAHGE